MRLTHNDENNNSRRWDEYRKRALSGDRTAQFNIGVCHEHGAGVPQNMEEAIAWFRRSAQQGFGPARRKLLEHAWPDAFLLTANVSSH
jgi:TPR repeat protein